MIATAQEAARLAERLEAKHTIIHADAARMLRRNWRTVARSPNLTTRLETLAGGPWTGRAPIPARHRHGAHKIHTLGDDLS